MPPIVCIAGRPDSGKTTLILRLIPELKARGYRVATIKHTSHDFEADTEGKDTFKHAQAGSDCVVLCSAHQLRITLPTERPLEPDDVAELIPEDFDIILAEGYKRSSLPKVEVHRAEIGPTVCRPEELMALVTDTLLDVDVAQFSPDDIVSLSDLIEKKLLK